MDVLALAVIHDHDEWNGLALGNQVVKDLSGVALGGPALLIFGISMLEIQDRILLVGVVLVLCGQIDIAVAHAFCSLGPIILLLDCALRHILDLPEIHVGGRDLDTAAPTSGTEEINGSGIGHRRSVDIQLIVVEAYILGIGSSGPYTILILDHLVPSAADVQLDGIGLRGTELGAYGTLGVHHGILMSQLVGYVRLEIFNGSGKRRDDVVPLLG